MKNSITEENLSSDKRDLRRFLLAFLGLFCIIALVVPLVLSLTFSEETLARFTMLISAFVEIGIIFVFSRIVLQRLGGKPALTTNFKPRQILEAFLLAAVAFLIARLTTDGIWWVYVGTTDDFESVKQTTGMDNWAFAAALLFLALIPAICEEMFYRVTVHALLKRRKASTIVALSSVAFCLAHIGSGWESMVSALILGIILIWKYIQTGNYWLVVAVHFLFNGFILFFSHKIYWITDIGFLSSRASSGAEAVFWGMVYLACALVTTGFAVLLVGRKDHVLSTLIEN